MRRYGTLAATAAAALMLSAITVRAETYGGTNTSGDASRAADTPSGSNQNIGSDRGTATQSNSSAGDMQQDQSEATGGKGSWKTSDPTEDQPTTTPDSPTLRPRETRPAGADTNDQYEASAGMGDDHVDPALRQRNLEEAMAPRHKSHSQTHKSESSSAPGAAAKPQSDAGSQSNDQNP